MTADLARILSPQSIAIVGVSQDFNKLSGRVMKFLIDKEFQGAIYPVNPKYDAVAGHRCYPEIGAIPGPVDLAVITLPARMVVDAVAQCGRAGVFGAVIFSSGFGEMGEDGRREEERLAETARAGGVRILGPNGLGLFNSFEGAAATFSQYLNTPTEPGPVGFVTQSGAFGTAICALARNRGVGFGHFVNTGNECDLEFSTMMAGVLDDPRIAVGAGYIEGLKDGAGFIAMAEKALTLGKPVAVTKVGKSDAGTRAAASHTGSLSGEDAVFDGVARQYGIIRARNEEHMLDVVQMLASTPLPAGRGVGIVTQSGGAGVLMADRAEELGLSVPLLADDTQVALRDAMPPFGAPGNPVDITGQFLAEPGLLRDSVEIMLGDPQVDIAVIWIQLMEQAVEELISIFRDLKASMTKPFVVVWVAAPEDALAGMHEIGICCMRGAEPAVDAIAGLVQFAEAREARAVDATARGAIVLPALALPDAGGPVPTVGAAKLLGEAGVGLAETMLAADEDGLRDAAEEFGYPLVLKIESADILHKTEANGVALGLTDWQATKDAHTRLLQDARAYKPDARIDGVVVQRMARGGVELVVGLQNDPVFGPVVMAGLGGVFVEVLKDVAFRHAPVTEAEAIAMLRQLKGAAMLDGVRGGPAVDLRSVARLIAAVSRFGAAAGDRLAELDLNPVLAGPDGAVAVDWLMVLTPRDGP
ncbi:MAG: acetate--CoA ligase family protein [Alphaproteobacteria bacterium]|nr:acetate--CoA ligase family protein [Alphaproteobacteria bacterium]